MQILPENVKILTWILPIFAWVSQLGGGLHPHPPTHPPTLVATSLLTELSSLV
jgi:hypothetical protein